MKMKRTIIFAGIIVLASAVFFFSCDNPIGLGDKLDLEGPTITIKSPEPRAIGEDFVLAGTIWDKSAIGSIKITARLGNEDIFPKQWRYIRGVWQVSEDSGKTWAALADSQWNGNASRAEWVAPLDMKINGDNTTTPEGEYMFTIQAWDANEWSDDNSLKTHVLIFDRNPPRVDVYNPPLHRAVSNHFKSGDGKFYDHYNPVTNAYTNDDPDKGNALQNLRDETDWEKPELLGKFLTQEFQLQWQLIDENAVQSIELLFYPHTTDVDGLTETERPEGYIYHYAQTLNPSDFNGSVWVPDLEGDAKVYTGSKYDGGEIKNPVTQRTTIKVVVLCKDKAGHINQEKVLGYFIYWPEAKAPWITFTDGMNTPGFYLEHHAGMDDKDFEDLCAEGADAKMFYPGRSIKANAFQAQGVSKVEFSLHNFVVDAATQNYDSPVDLGYMTARDPDTVYTDETRKIVIRPNEQRKSGNYSTIFAWDFTPPARSANYIVRARAFDSSEEPKPGKYFYAVFRVQDTSFPDFPTQPAPSAGEPLFKFIGKPEADDAPNNVPANSIRISGMVADATAIESVYMVWINPESKGYAGMSQLAYFRDSNYKGWTDVIAANLADGASMPQNDYDPLNPNRVWKLTVTDTGLLNSEDRKQYKYEQVINLKDLNITDVLPPKENQPLKSQVFLLRAEGPDPKKCTIITYAPQGDESAPEIKITEVQIGSKTFVPNHYKVVDQFTGGEEIIVKGTWKEDSVASLPIGSYFTNNFIVTVNGISVPNTAPSLILTQASPTDDSGTWTASLTINSTQASNLRDTLVVNVEGKDIGGNIAEAGASWLIESDHLQLMRISSENTDKTYRSGDVIDIFLEFNKAVQISNYSTSNPPRLVLNIGATVYATYVNSNSQSTRHHFTYTVANGQNIPKLDVTGLNNANNIAWNANNYPFTWQRGDEQIRITTIDTHNGGLLPAPNNFRARRLPTSTSGSGTDVQYSLGGGKNIAIDTTAPTVQSITASQAGNYTTGGVITITVNFSEPVEFNTSSPPQLFLQGYNGNSNTLSLATNGSVSGNATNALTFTYTVAAGDTTRGNALSIRATGGRDHSGTITDLAGNALAGTTISSHANANATLTGRYVDALAPAAPTVRLFSTANPTNVNNDNTITSRVNNVNVQGFSAAAAKNLGNVYHPALYLAIEGTTTSVGGTSTGTHKLSRLEYSINGGTSWVRLVKTNNSLNIDNTPILLPQPGSYVLVARQIDRAGNESTVTPALTFIWDRGSLISRIDSTTANGTYSNNTTTNSINITVYFRKSLTFSGTQTITLNATRGSTPITVSQTVNGSRSELSFTYTIQNNDNTPAGSGRTPYLDVTALSLNATDNTTAVPNDLPDTANRLGQRKDIIVTTGPLEPTAAQPTYVITTANDEATGTISITFNRAISKGSGNITIAQSTTGYRLPAVLTEAQSARYRNARNFSANYTRGTNGFINGTGSDTATKYVLNYTVDTVVNPTGTSAIEQMAADFLAAETVTLPVTSQDVTVSGSTLTITLSGSNALQVLGAPYTVTIPQNCVRDSLGYSWPTATGGQVYDTNTNRLTTPGINKSFVRVDKQFNKDTVARTTGNGSLTNPWLTSTQPTQTTARLDCRTPNSVVRYVANGQAYNTTGTTTNGTTNPDQVGSRSDWTNTDGASNQIDTGSQSDPQTNNGTNYTTFTGTTIDNTGPHIRVGDNAEQGYVWRITARGRNSANGNTYSEMSDEVAFRTVLTVQLAGVYTSDIGAGPASGDQLWVRGGDAISSSSVPGFPLTWSDDYDSLRTEGKRAGVRLLRMASVGTGNNANFSAQSQWKWVTWEINVQTYFDVVLGRDVTTAATPDAAKAWQYGPRTWAYQRGGWTILKDLYTLYPGKHRWVKLYQRSFAPGGYVNWSHTFSNRPDLATSIPQ